MKYCCYMVGIATTRPHSQQAGRRHDWIFCDNNRLGGKKRHADESTQMCYFKLYNVTLQVIIFFLRC